MGRSGSGKVCSCLLADRYPDLKKIIPNFLILFSGPCHSPTGMDVVIDLDAVCHLVRVKTNSSYFGPEVAHNTIQTGGLTLSTDKARTRCRHLPIGWVLPSTSSSLINVSSGLLSSTSGIAAASLAFSKATCPSRNRPYSPTSAFLFTCLTSKQKAQIGEMTYPTLKNV